MEEEYKYIGRIMKAARRFKKANQESVSKAIGCSQSALSKLEHGSLVPSAPQWFVFCRHLEIPVYSIETWVIDRLTPILPEDINPPIRWNKRYRSHRQIKSRELYPLVSYLRESRGDDAVEQMFKELDIDIDLAVDFDYQINHLVLFDVLNYFVQKSIISGENIKLIADQYAKPVVHGELYHAYQRSHSLKELLDIYLRDQQYYQADLCFEISNLSERGCSLIIKADKHLEGFLKETNPAIVSLYGQYLKLRLEALFTQLLKRKVSVTYVGAGQALREFPERLILSLKWYTPLRDSPKSQLDISA